MNIENWVLHATLRRWWTLSLSLSLIECAGPTHASGGIRPPVPPNIEIRIESPFAMGVKGGTPLQ